MPTLSLLFHREEEVSEEQSAVSTKKPRDSNSKDTNTETNKLKHKNQSITLIIDYLKKSNAKSGGAHL